MEAEEVLETREMIVCAIKKYFRMNAERSIFEDCFSQLHIVIGESNFPTPAVAFPRKKQKKKKIVPSLPGSEVHYYVLIFDPLFPGRGRKTLQKKITFWTRESGIQDDVFLFFEMLMQPRNFVGTLQMHRDFFFFLRVRKSFHCFIFPRCISTWHINGPDLGLEGGG